MPAGRSTTPAATRGLGWLKNGCAVLPAPDREWLNRGLPSPKSACPPDLPVRLRGRCPHAGDHRGRPPQGLPHRRRARRARPPARPAAHHRHPGGLPGPAPVGWTVGGSTLGGGGRAWDRPGAGPAAGRRRRTGSGRASQAGRPGAGAVGRPRPQERPPRRNLRSHRRPQRSLPAAGWRGGPGGGVAPVDQAPPGPGGRPHPDHQPAAPTADGPGPGGARRNLTAKRAAALLAAVTPAGAPAVTRWQLATELVADVRQLEERIATVEARIKTAVAQSNTTLLALFGVGPVLAARFLGEVGDIGRFPTKHHFAAHTGTAP